MKGRFLHMSARFEIPINTSASETVTVTRELTVGHLIPGMPEVYGTPFMIYLMEHAAAEAIKPLLPPGWISVGTLVNVRHLAATPVGFSVTATATVVSVSRHLITFAVKAHDGVDLIGEGTHERAVVELDRLNAKIGTKKAAK
jgi:fluoroacetyl-CoA thioesterase